MAETMTTKPTNDELINQMYDASLAGQKSQLAQSRDQGMADLQAEQERLQKQTDANLNRTYVEAARDQKNYAEVQNAYGLTSGAMAQARLAQDNQLEADLTALRGAQANIDANIEREKTMLSQQYMAAIAQAQADNDLKRAQALYDQARRDEDQLRQNQLDAGKLMASVGDYTILANLYGLTPQQLALLMPNGVPGSGGSAGGNSVSQYFDANGIPQGFETWEEYLDYLNNGNTPPDGGGQPPAYSEVYLAALNAWNDSGNKWTNMSKITDAAVADGFSKDDADAIMRHISTQYGLG